MVAALAPDRDFRRPGCTGACHVVKALIPGQFGRSELLLHDPSAHEEYGRQQASERTGVVETGSLVVDILRCEVKVDGHVARLTATETRMLMTLARHGGLLVETRHLIESALGEEYLSDGWQSVRHLLRVHIARLRLKLGQAGNLITTVLATGYRLEMVAPGGPIPTRLALTRGGRPTHGRWSIAFDACMCCGLAEAKHTGHGRCQRCRSKGRHQHYGPCRMPGVTS